MMHCKECEGGRLLTFDTRQSPQNPEWVQRRRKCEDCGNKIVTLEIPRDELGWEETDVSDQG